SSSFSFSFSAALRFLHSFPTRRSSDLVREIESSLPWIPVLLILIGLKFPLIFFFGVLLLLGRQAIYGLELARNHFPFSFIFYYVDRKSTRLNSSHVAISYAVFCLKKKK